MFLHCRYINARAQASASWFDNAREGKKTLARKHGHLRVLLLSASESERRFGSVFHHHEIQGQTCSGPFLFSYLHHRAASSSKAQRTGDSQADRTISVKFRSVIRSSGVPHAHRPRISLYRDVPRIPNFHGFARGGGASHARFYCGPSAIIGFSMVHRLDPPGGPNHPRDLYRVGPVKLARLFDLNS